MKKYQEALDRFEEAFRNVTLDDDLTNERQDLLQELVDKETPMKPKRNKRYCGNCDTVRLLPYDNYCSNCGQKIDWSDEEWIEQLVIMPEL